MTSTDLQATIAHMGAAARAASSKMAAAPTAAKNGALIALARLLRESAAPLAEANQKDIAAATAAGLAAPMVDRLRLTAKVIDTVAEGCEQIAAMPDPIGEITGVRQRPSGISVGQMRVPLGVFGMIYESRPNVTIEAASLAIKSGNACILRGGSEAIHSNLALWKLVQAALVEAGLPPDAVQLVQTTDRAAVGYLIASPEAVDVIIPRGGKGLIERISREARVPVIKHLDGNCHVYVDAVVDLEMALRVTDNAKTQKYSPCNAAESLLVHEAIAPSFLPRIGAVFAAKGVEMRVDSASQALLEGRAERATHPGHRAGLERGVPRPHHQREGGGGARRGHRPHQPLQLAPHRRHPHRQPQPCDALRARGRLGQRDGQRQHAICRRLRVRPGRRDRHQHRQVPRPRAGGAGGADLDEVGGARPRGGSLMTPRRALVLFSGGQDSTVCLAWALERYRYVETIGFDYSQRHGVELECRLAVRSQLYAQFPRWGGRLGDDHMIDLSLLGQISRHRAHRRARDRDDARPACPTPSCPGATCCSSTSPPPSPTAAALNVLVGGMCETDYSGYPDCRDNTLKSLQVSLSLGLDTPMGIETPLMWLDKAQTWELSATLGGEELNELIVEHTHTCYLGDRQRRHDWGYGCGQCPSCALRGRGFKAWRSRHTQSPSSFQATDRMDL